MSYNSVINACAQGGQLEAAVQWLQAMKEQGIIPDDNSYNSVINACAQGGQVEQATEWLQAMKAQGIKPNIVTYNSVIKACGYAKPGALRDGLHLAAFRPALKAVEPALCGP